MARSDFGWTDFFGRLLVALVLVFVSYNPEGFSYYHWAITKFPEVTVLKVFAGVVLLIGWVILLATTQRSLGFLGLMLGGALLGGVVWLLVDIGVLNVQTVSSATWGRKRP